MSKTEVLKYSISFFLVIGVGFLNSYFLDYGNGETMLLLFTGLIIVIARYLGRGQAIFSIFITSLIIAKSLFFSKGEFNWSLQQFTKLSLFVLECGIIIYIIYAYMKEMQTGILKEKRFNTLIEKSSQAFIMVELNGSCIYCNAAVQKITGYSLLDLANLSVWNLIKQEEQVTVKECFFKVASHEGRSSCLIHRLRRFDGEYIWIENTMTNLLNDHAIKAIVFNFTDITSRVRHERDMEDILGIASHELKTPLTSLKAYTQVLEMRMAAEGNSSSVILVNKMDRQINRIISMIFDLLDATKLQSGILVLKKSLFDVNDLIIEVVDSLKNVNQNHQFILSLARSTEIFADRVRVSQVLVNLISNAVKYSPESDKIQIESRYQYGFLIVSVIDFGIGISSLEIQKLFNRFYRVSSIRESYQGLGLGLYISYQIIDQHRGKMGVSSEEGSGSTFWFSLPLEQFPGQ